MFSEEATKPHSAAEGAPPESVSFSMLLLMGSAVGIAGGTLAFAYSQTLHLLLAGVWDHLRPFLSGNVGDGVSLLMITTCAGLFLGLALRKMGAPGEIAAVVNNIHVEDGRLPIRQTPSMLVTSLISITGGGSAGPEAPLVQMSGSLGSWLGDRLNWFTVHVRTLTFCGMAAALGAFFGAPLAGAVFALEIPHRNGLEYYEALLPSIVAAFLSYFIFDALGGTPHPLFPLVLNLDGPMTALILKGVLLGALGAGIAHLFNIVFRLSRRILERWKNHTVSLATVGGFLIGLLAIACPPQLPISTLFWGEFQMRELLMAVQENGLPSAWLVPLLVLAGMKILAVSVTLNTGFRGGFIFPLFFIGGVIGIAVSLITGGWFTMPVAVICLMGAVNVGVTRTPISSSILLVTLSGVAALPLVLAACLSSFLLTARIRMIHTQRSRMLPGTLTWRDQQNG